MHSDTILGRSVKDMDVVRMIENARVLKEKPVDDIKYINISVE